MNGGGSRALLGQSKKKKAKSKLAAEASARKRKEEKERRLAVQQQEATSNFGGFRDTEDVTSAHGMHLMWKNKLCMMHILETVVTHKQPQN